MRRVGLDKKLRREWLEETAFYYLAGASPRETALHLDQYLQGEITGKESRKKTIRVLARAWVAVEGPHQPLRDRALAMLKGLPEPERLALHWGMCLLAFPLFRDLAAVTGNLAGRQAEFTQGQINRRIIQDWGARSTLKWAVPRLVRSLALWGVIQGTAPRGTYRAAPPTALQGKTTGVWLLECYLRSSGEESIPLEAADHLPALFPFSPGVAWEHILESPAFQVHRRTMGGDALGLAP